MTKEQTTDARYGALILEAQKLGREAGQNAAAWWHQDALGGRSPLSGARLRDAAQKMLAAYDDGDYSDWPDAPSLSGEWADSMTPQRLYVELDCEPEEDDDDYGICHAWEDAASEAHTDAILEYLKSAATD
jgi:hypothetical protein